MFIRVSGAKLFVDVEGASVVLDGDRWTERPTVVLLHGGPGADHLAFKPWLSKLSAVAQLVYIDQRGSGRSTHGGPSSWNLTTWACDVRELCDRLGLDKPIILGQSSGTVVAMKYAIDYPDHPGALVLASPYAIGDFSSSYPLFHRLGGEPAAAAAHDFWESPTQKTLERYVRLCRPLYGGTPRRRLNAPGQRSLNTDVLLHYAADEHQSLDLRTKLAGIQCPTLLLTGGSDPLTPPYHAREIIKYLRPELSMLHIFPHAGHHVFLEAPRASFRRTVEFIRQVKRGDAVGSP